MTLRPRIRMGFAVLIIAGLAPTTASATVYVVDSTGNQPDATAGTGACATAAPVRCTLRAAIQTANATAAGAPHTITFAIPTTDAGYTAATGVFTIVPATLLPSLTRAGTVIDGRTQATSAAGNTNALTLGTGGTVGVDGLPLPQLPAPEILIRDNAALTIGLDVAANDIQIRGLAIHGFGNSTTTGDIRVGTGASLTGIQLIGNLIGAAPAPAPVPTLPAVVAQRTAGNGIVVNGPDSGMIRDNIVAFAAFSGIAIRGTATGWTVSGNELRANAVNQPAQNGLTVEAAGSINNVVSGNLITASGGAGIDTPPTTAGPNRFENNTVSGNGVLNNAATETSGIRLQGIGNLVDRNVISANYGAGVLVVSAAGANRITRNSIAGNGTILNAGGVAATGQIGIDLLVAANNQAQGTTPFVSLNDLNDADAGGNGVANYPVLTAATRVGGDLVVTGFARPGAVIELFVAAPDPSGFGEGQTYLTTLVEGSGADTDAAIGAYGPGAINGRAQGTDTANAFRFTIPVTGLPAAPGAGAQLTATSTLLGATSEFSGNVTVTGAAATADISVTLSDVPDPVAAGQPITYVARVANAGPQAATGVTTTFALPPGATSLSLEPSQGSCSQSGQTVTCSIGVIPAGGSETITVVARPSSTGQSTATVTATLAESDPAPANNTASATTTITGAVGTSDLSVVVNTSQPAPTVIGRPAAITMIVTNRGIGPVTGVRAVLTVTGARALTILPSSGTCQTVRSGQTRTITCVLGALDARATGTVAVVAQASRTGRIRVNGTAAMDQVDATPASNTNIGGSTAAPQGRLTIRIDAPRRLRAGQPAPYAIVVSNRGRVTARGVVVTVVLPQRDSVLTSVTTAHTSRSLSFFVGDIAAGGTQRVSLVAMVDPAAGGVRRISAASIAGGGVAGAHTTTAIRVGAGVQVPVTG